jgi:uncharacterized protein (TIGR02466 family)
MMIDLFKITIYEKKLKLKNEEIINYSYKLKKKDLGKQISNVGGWQSNDLQGVHKPLNELFEDIEHYGNEYGKLLGLKLPLKIDNIWININEYKDFNLEHFHGNSLISGVYYVKVQKKSGNIVFSNPSIDIMQQDWNKYTINEHNTNNSPKWVMPSKTNTLYLFPNYLKHFVQPNFSNSDRISISFNLTKNY